MAAQDVDLEEDLQMRYVVTLLLVSLLFATPALAVNIQITDGFAAQRSGGDTAPFDLIGADFRFQGGTTDTNSGGSAGVPPFGVLGGAVVVNNAQFIMGPFGPLTYQDMTFTRTSGFFLFSGSAIIMPTEISRFAEAVGQFTMTGSATAYSAPGVVFETFDLTGQGIMTINYTTDNVNSPQVSLNRISLAFEAPSAGGGPVVPEPSTVLVLASGLAGLGLWRRRASTKQHVG